MAVRGQCAAGPARGPQGRLAVIAASLQVPSTVEDILNELSRRGRRKTSACCALPNCAIPKGSSAVACYEETLFRQF